RPRTPRACSISPCWPSGWIGTALPPDAHAMIGSATATLDAWPRRTLVRLLGGSPDVGMRQRWDALWPSLASLPQSTLRVLDAGCGPGTWTLEIAARRPQWRVVGIDRIADSTAAAAHAARRLGIANAAFTCADFERFH